eukprot:TRINITY_DN928_c0_g2_i1.p1 TRINITY_DN928_c0_g2~~TRINITY_DN928_c0_g2_i1.p1  ORF type:complete len:207 (+),score=6.71 TRINITY_DN928_c0_g2_i1:39-623(+)
MYTPAQIWPCVGLLLYTVLVWLLSFAANLRWMPDFPRTVDRVLLALALVPAGCSACMMYLVNMGPLMLGMYNLLSILLSTTCCTSTWDDILSEWDEVDCTSVTYLNITAYVFIGIGVLWRLLALIIISFSDFPMYYSFSAASEQGNYTVITSTSGVADSRCCKITTGGCIMFLYVFGLLTTGFFPLGGDNIIVC